MSDYSNMYKLRDADGKVIFKKTGSALQIEKRLGKTQEAINQMNPLDVIGGLPDELQRKIFDPVIDQNIRRQVFSSELSDALWREWQNYTALKRMNDFAEVFFESRQEVFDEDHGEVFEQDMDDRYINRPTLLDGIDEETMNEDGRGGYDTSRYATYSDYPEQGGGANPIPIHRVVEGEEIGDLQNKIGNRINLEDGDEIERMERNLFTYFGKDDFDDFLQETVGEFYDDNINETIDNYMVYDNLYGPFTNYTGTFSEPFATDTIRVGKRSDFIARVQEIHQELTEASEEILGDEADDYDGEELFDAARDKRRTREDDEEVPEVDDRHYELQTEYEDLMMISDRAGNEGNQFIVSPRTIAEYQRRVDEARDEYIEMLEQSQALLEGSAVLDTDDFDDDYFEGRGFTREDLQRLYRFEEEIDE